MIAPVQLFFYHRDHPIPYLMSGALLLKSNLGSYKCCYYDVSCFIILLLLMNPYCNRTVEAMKRGSSLVRAKLHSLIIVWNSRGRDAICISVSLQFESTDIPVIEG